MRNDFFTAFSHELETPITVARCDIEGMINNIGRYKDCDRYLAHAYQVLGDMERLVQEIISVTRTSSEQMWLSFAPTDLSALTKEVCEDYQALAEHHSIAMSYRIAPQVMASVDSFHLRKVISNLISNAIYHSSEGSEVKVVLSENQFQVTNTSASIPPDEMDNIFLPFYRLDKSRSRHTGGSGLGLHYVKTILDLHGFPITIESIDNTVNSTVKII